MSAEFPVAPPLETLRVTLNSIPRHAMGGKRARALNGIGLGCTAEPRRAA